MGAEEPWRRTLKMILGVGMLLDAAAAAEAAEGSSGLSMKRSLAPRWWMTSVMLHLLSEARSSRFQMVGTLKTAPTGLWSLVEISGAQK